MTEQAQSLLEQVDFFNNGEDQQESKTPAKRKATTRSQARTKSTRSKASVEVTSKKQEWEEF
jgi:methyl-accepting chemotaxis protein